jgi:uncharacterized protein YndB with AHSA1/START domain
MSETTFILKRDENKVVIERVFKAPREDVWQTITDPQLIPRWWGPEKYPTRVNKMDVRVGGTWRFISQDGEGNEFAFSGVYKEVDPPGRLVQTFNYEPIEPGHESTETAVLEQIADGTTRLTITSVYNSVGDYDGMVASGMETGARETWERLAALLEKEHKMANNDKQITITRVFNAPKERVWQAWTDPVQIAQWWGPEGFGTRVEELDFQVGGRWRYVMIGPDGAEYPSEGTFLEIDSYEKIVTTDEFGEDYQPPELADLPQGIVTTVLFAELEGQTKLTIDILHGTIEDKLKHERMGVIPGWNSSLDCLEEHLAGLVAAFENG